MNPTGRFGGREGARETVRGPCLFEHTLTECVMGMAHRPGGLAEGGLAVRDSIPEACSQSSLCPWMVSDSQEDARSSNKRERREQRVEVPDG